MEPSRAVKFDYAKLSAFSVFQLISTLLRSVSFHPTFGIILGAKNLSLNQRPSNDQ